jgi:hypothetical protein
VWQKHQQPHIGFHFLGLIGIQEQLSLLAHLDLRFPDQRRAELREKSKIPMTFKLGFEPNPPDVVAPVSPKGEGGFAISLDAGAVGTAGSTFEVPNPPKRDPLGVKVEDCSGTALLSALRKSEADVKVGTELDVVGVLPNRGLGTGGLSSVLLAAGIRGEDPNNEVPVDERATAVPKRLAAGAEVAALLPNKDRASGAALPLFSGTGGAKRSVIGGVGGADVDLVMRARVWNGRCRCRYI